MTCDKEKSFAVEVQAVAIIYGALANLDKKQAERILRFVTDKLGMSMDIYE